MTLALEVADLTVSLGDLEIIKGVDLELPFGEIHALMGPNGSGKSTLSHVLMGNQEFTASGSVLLDGEEILDLPVDERARRGLFTTFQYPIEIPGVTLEDLIAELVDAAGNGELAGRVATATTALGMGRFLDRPINQGLSGGEKKRSELFQLSIADPKVAVLDEIDSGLDVDAVREVAGLVEGSRSDNLGVLLITHYSRILNYMQPDRIHVMIDGRVVRSGGREVADELEARGYEALRAELGLLPERDPLLDLP